MNYKKKIYLVKKKIKNFKVFLLFRKFNILNDRDSVSKIISTKKSVARFGDGELNLIFNSNLNINFQKNSNELSNRLREILNSKTDDVLIGLPNKFVTLHNNTLESKEFWMNYIIENKDNIINNVDMKKEYINTNFTRFYMDYKNKRSVSKKVKDIRRIWENRNIVIVEGDMTRLGVGNDFFDNARSIERIICPNKNAFDCYDKILNECKKLSKKKLIIIALGPTATVLAYDLGMLGYQAIDVGHVDIEYEWFLKNAKDKIAIDGKFVNEAKSNDNVNLNINDDEYNKSIKKVITLAKEGK